jgi:hypothetical protein
MDCSALTNAKCTAHLPSLTLAGVRGRRVKEYWVYSIDEGGRITGERIIAATDDDEALFAVRSMQRPLVTELWYRDRRVGRVAAHVPAPQEWPLPSPPAR